MGTNLKRFIGLPYGYVHNHIGEHKHLHQQQSTSVGRALHFSPAVQMEIQQLKNELKKSRTN